MYTTIIRTDDNVKARSPSFPLSSLFLQGGDNILRGATLSFASVAVDTPRIYYDSNSNSLFLV